MHIITFVEACAWIFSWVVLQLCWGIRLMFCKRRRTLQSRPSLLSFRQPFCVLCADRMNEWMNGWVLRECVSLSHSFFIHPPALLLIYIICALSAHKAHTHTFTRNVRRFLHDVLVDFLRAHKRTENEIENAQFTACRAFTARAARFPLFGWEFWLRISACLFLRAERSFNLKSAKAVKKEQWWHFVFYKMFSVAL